MRYRLGLSVGFFAVANVLQPALLPARAHACGGLFCDSSQPVNQAAERILFVRNADDTITAAIEIKYEGPPERFSWVLPVPGVPKVSVSSTVAFDRLQAATNPQYRLQPTFEDCGDDGRKGGGVPTSNSGGSDAGLGPVKVLASGSVGPYDYKVISVDDSAPDAAQAAVDWLMENKYDLFDNGPELLRPYLEDGLNLIAFRLNKDSDKGAIRPVVLTYASEYPFIPIRPTAVAANDDMGVLVWVAGESRAIARNYKTLELNDALINWWNPGSNYDDVVSAAADEAGGQGFVTELAQPSKMLKGVVINDDDLAYWMEVKGSAEKLGDAAELLAGTADRFGTWDGFRDAVTKFSSLPNDTSLDNFLMCPRCNTLPAQFTLDAQGFVDTVQAKVIDPMVETQRLVTSQPYVTRMYTTMSADEMTMDPLFDFNADLPDVSNLHVADTFVHCDGTYRVSLPSGGTLYGADQGSWPSDELADAKLPATRVISQLGPRGDGKVITDNAAVIDQALEATPSARAYTGSEDCGCSVPGRPRSSQAALLVISMLAFAGGLRRLRRHRHAAQAARDSETFSSGSWSASLRKPLQRFFERKIGLAQFVLLFGVGRRGSDRRSMKLKEKDMQIREIMSKSVVSCRPGDTLNTAAQLMWEHDCGAIPVTGDDGKLVGMITDRDICMATYTKGCAPQAISVADAMASQVFSCRADESIAAAEQLMRNKQVRRIPITDAEDRVLGLLSVGDVVRQATSLRKKEGPEREILQTIASICQPRSQATKSAAVVHTRKQASAQS